MADDVRLTDLQVIQRYSIAVRGETAERDELVRALRADLDWLQGSARPGRAAEDRVPARAAAPRRAAPAKRPAKKAAKPARGSR